jgi:hypothetical protein
MIEGGVIERNKLGFTNHVTFYAVHGVKRLGDGAKKLHITFRLTTFWRPEQGLCTAKTRTDKMWRRLAVGMSEAIDLGKQ